MLAVGAGGQSEPKDARAARAARAAVPQLKAAVLLGHGRGEDVHVVELARRAQRDDRPVGVFFPRCGASQRASSAGGSAARAGWAVDQRCGDDHDQRRAGFHRRCSSRRCQIAPRV